MSFSSATAVSAGRVSVWPVEFNTYAYSYVIGKRDFWNSLLKSVERVCIGVPFSMLITILVAYPLSKERTQLRLRSFYSWIFFLPCFFRRADSRISADSESASDGYHLGADSPYGCSCLQHCTYAEFFGEYPVNWRKRRLLTEPTSSRPASGFMCPVLSRQLPRSLYFVSLPIGTAILTD